MTTPSGFTPVLYYRLPTPVSIFWLGADTGSIVTPPPPELPSNNTPPEATIIPDGSIVV